MPRCQGHTLVLPKTPARNMLDASPAQLAACMKTAQKVANAVMKAFNADGITLQQFNEPAGGQVVFHLHFHVLPRWEGMALGPHTAKMEKPEVLSAYAEKIKAELV
jgi:histidine triad (HIT) family protein